MAFAANVNWLGTTTDWQVGANWSSNTAPTSSDTVTINTVTPSPTILANGTGNTGALLVGTTGTGSLTLDSGVGLTSTGSSSIGDQAGGTGVVTVRGSTSWLLSGMAMLDVGKYGNGTLHVLNGALVTAANVGIGSQAGSTGLATADGANSAMQITDTLIVGGSGTGTLNISNGAQVTAADTAYVGQAASSIGTVTVDGAQSLLSAKYVNVGSSGTGTATVTGGATLNADLILNIAHATGANGTVTVSGTGSKLQVGSGSAANVYVGDSGGTGTLNVQSGASAVIGGSVTLGNAAGATGTLNLSGTGTTFLINPVAGAGGNLVVGEGGQGIANLGNAASLTADVAIVGDQGTSQGTLNIQSGASTTLNNDLTVALASGSTGTVTVTGAGSNLTIGSGMTGTMTIGNGGSGTLNVLAGAHVTAHGLTSIGNTGGSHGSVTVDGSGSQLTVGNNLYVGLDGAGSMTASNGGRVDVSANLTLGAHDTGNITVAGTGSTLNVGGNDFFVSNNANASVNVTGGAKINANNVTIGNGTGIGQVTVDGAGSSIQAHTLTVGYQNSNATDSSVTISNGGAVSARTGTIGANNGATGTVLVTGAGSTLNLTSAVVGTSLMIGDAGTGSLTVANGATVNASGKIVIGAQAGGHGYLTIGTAPGGASTAPGVLNTTGIQFGPGGGDIIFNHNSSAYVFSTPLVGNGIIDQTGGHTILTGDSSGFTGFAAIAGGILSVNGSLGSGNINVQNGGTLGGTGSIGTLFVGIGGILAPGNSIGALTVAQDAQFANRSIYQVQLDAAGHSDKLVVGTTTLLQGGTVEAQVQPGKYGASTKYTILTSAGGVTGTFSGATSDVAFLTPTLSYDANDVYLTMTRNAASFASVGSTRNQIATGAGVDSLGYGNAIWNAVVTYNATQARSAYDQLSGDIHASTVSTLAEDSRLLRAAAIDRLREAFRNAGVGNPSMAYAAMGDTPAAPDTPFAMWGRVIGSWGSTESDGNAAALTRKTSGFFSGFDARIVDDWRVGVLSGYTRANLNSVNVGSSATVDTYHAGVYAGTQWGALALRTGAAYGWHHIDASRTIAIPGFTDRLASAYGADTAQVFGEFGYNIALAQRAAIEPFAGLAYVDIHRNGFAETGGPAALTANAANTGLGVSTLGLRGAVGFDLGGTDATWKGTLGWRHAYGDVTPATTFTFAGGDPFTTAGLPIARDAATIDTGFDIALARNVRFGVAYTGQLAKSLQDHGIKADFDWKF